ncbi:MAG TPA: hypothetical protein VGD42_18800 [Lysobacter sp.]
MFAVGPVLAADGDECTFDQAYLAEARTELAGRHPGGRIDADGVSWRLDSGDVVTVGHGGCVDLGTVVRIAFAPGSSRTTEEAIDRLLTATARYWSAEDARHLAATLSQGKFVTRVLDHGAIEYQSTRDETSRFTFGFTLTVSADVASVSWTDA